MRATTQKFAVIAWLVLFCMAFEPNEACRLLDGGFEETWMKTGNLFLSSLQKGSVPTPGNGCSSTGNGGGSCIGSKKVAGGHGDGAPLPTPSPRIPSLTHAYPQHMVEFGVTGDGK
ncbi:unnamed protein product [Lactuca saligna]|uniref:Uncharacterized protein n=1 Tax=Lactuca saligna TaxID=75948 RepID=A0AA36E9S8_LACSI|nr:unnamed protein product [Lactuca saligna]